MIQDAADTEESPRTGQYAQIATKLQSDGRQPLSCSRGRRPSTVSDVASFEPHAQESYILAADLGVGGNQ
jgi:hypothetical protein